MFELPWQGARRGAVAWLFLGGTRRRRSEAGDTSTLDVQYLSEFLMGKLSGQDIANLAQLLAGTLDFSDLESFVFASTGDRLYDAFVAKDQPKTPMIRKLLEELEDLGTTSDFLAYVYLNRPGRK